MAAHAETFLISSFWVKLASVRCRISSFCAWLTRVALTVRMSASICRKPSTRSATVVAWSATSRR